LPNYGTLRFFRPECSFLSPVAFRTTQNGCWPGGCVSRCLRDDGSGML
jgi:hypothetical protein